MYKYIKRIKLMPIQRAISFSILKLILWPQTAKKYNINI